MSSSRVHSSFTGFNTALLICAAWMMKSMSMRRPKPPPRNVVSSVTVDGSRFTALAITDCAASCHCVGPIRSILLPRYEAVKFIGSIGECDRFGQMYSARITLAPGALIAASGSPTVLSTSGLPVPAAALVPASMSAVLRLALGPSSQTIFNAARALRACQ